MIPRLHLITDDSILRRPGFLAQARSAIQVGGEGVAFHLRGHGVSGRAIFEAAETLQEACRTAGGTLLVNDRLDVALALDLPGAHLSQRSLPPGVARELLGSERVLGLSVHSKEEGEAGREGSVDFFVVGTLFDTKSHPGRVPGGVGRLSEIATTDPPLMIGIGGITPKRVDEVLKAGAHGIAVRGGIWNAPDPAEAVGVYLGELDRCSGQTGGKARGKDRER
ncbi:MAG: thiamine phosphate synthase [Gemmatimonadota bacterium]